MAETRAVASWHADYDIFDPGFVRDPYPIWRELRSTHPLPQTERWGGSWMPTRYEDISHVAHDTEHFSSLDITVAPIPATYDDAGNRLRSIIATDPPHHTPERRVILPFFSPKATEKYVQHTRDLANRLIDGFVHDGTVDAAAGYSRQIPPRIIAAILGIDPARGDEFAEWVQGVLELGLKDPVIREKYRLIIGEFFLEQIAYRQKHPGDDLISWLLSQKIDGEAVPMHVVRGNVGLMLIAGIDTTWSSIGSALWHLASHPADTARLVADPSLIPNAVEEFLRAYSPVTMARLVSKEVTVGGKTMHPGDRVLLSFPAANRDPAMFDRPEEVIIDREHNRHIAFGVGIHRCAGSNLARMEMRVALEEWLKRIPRFRLVDPDSVIWAGGQVRGPRSLVVEFP